MDIGTGSDRDLRGAPDKRLVGFDEHVKESLAETGVSGVAIAIVAENNKIVYAKGFGNVDNSNGAKEGPVDADTMLPLNTAGDAIVGLLMATLVEDGLLQWDLPLAPYFSSISHPQTFANQLITLSDLLSHRSGLPSTNNSLAANLVLESPLTQIPVAISAIPSSDCPSFRCNSARSQLNITLAALAALRVTGENGLDVLLRERVWNRVGASPKSGAIAEGREDTSSSQVSTTRDLARLVAGMLGGWGCVSGFTFSQMCQPVGVLDMPFDGVVGGDELQGFTVGRCGFVNSVYRGRRRVSFGSSMTGVEVVMFPDQSFGVVVMASTARPSHLPMALANIASDFLLSELPIPWTSKLEKMPLPGSNLVMSPISTTPPPLQPSAPMSRALSTYAGVYLCPSAPTVALRIAVDETASVLIASISSPGASSQNGPPGGSQAVLRPSVGGAQLHQTYPDVFTIVVADLLQQRLPMSRVILFTSRHATLLFRPSVDGSVEGLTMLCGNATPNSSTTISSSQHGTFFRKMTSLARTTSAGATATVAPSATLVRQNTAGTNPVLPPRRLQSQTSSSSATASPIISASAPKRNPPPPPPPHRGNSLSQAPASTAPPSGPPLQISTLPIEEATSAVTSAPPPTARPVPPPPLQLSITATGIVEEPCGVPEPLPAETKKQPSCQEIEAAVEALMKSRGEPEEEEAQVGAGGDEEGETILAEDNMDELDRVCGELGIDKL